MTDGAVRWTPVRHDAAMTDDGTARLEEFLTAGAAHPSSTVVALDFDGVLAPIVDDPADSRPADGAMAAMADLARRGVGVVILTGRAPDTAAHLAGLDVAPADLADGLAGVIVYGHYGRQTWTPDPRKAGGRLSDGVGPEVAAAVTRVRDALPGLLRDHDAPAGVRVEDKGISLVVHTRQAAHPQAALDSLAGPLSDLAAREGLHAEPGKLVLEIRPGGVDKGATLQSLLTDGVTAAAYAGDDLGDLPALAAVTAARDRGLVTLAVASGQPGMDERVATAADLVVDGPAGVVAVLRRLADALG